jgi:hypothetical protein
MGSMKKKSQMKVSTQLVEELIQALKELGGWGSVEVYVQGGKVTQITKRAIKKTNHPLEIGA